MKYQQSIFSDETTEKIFDCSALVTKIFLPSIYLMLKDLSYRKTKWSPNPWPLTPGGCKS